jgi:seryl-tRNA synthetase
MTTEELQAKVEELQATNAQLVESIGKLETANKDLVEQRQQLKEKLKEGANDEELKKELDSYKKQLEKVEAEKSEIEQSYTQKLSKMQIKQMLKEAGVKAHNDDAFESIAELALDGAKYDGGAFVYTDEEGKTLFNEANKPYSVLDKVNELRDSEKSYLFVQDTGGDTPKDKSTAPNTKPSIADFAKRVTTY